MTRDNAQEDSKTRPTTPTLDRRDLITYAFVNQNILGIDDRLAGLLPFFEPILREMQGAIFDPNKFTDLLTDDTLVDK